MRRRWAMIVLAGAAAAWCAPLAVVGGVHVGIARAASGVVTTGGAWPRAIEVPGLGALNKGGGAGVNSVSCASAGNCAAAGSYVDGSGLGRQAFVAVERNGRWAGRSRCPGRGP
jgi:hypothetical protein